MKTKEEILDEAGISWGWANFYELIDTKLFSTTSKIDAIEQAMEDYGNQRYAEGKMEETEAKLLVAFEAGILYEKGISKDNTSLSHQYVLNGFKRWIRPFLPDKDKIVTLDTNFRKYS